MLLIRHYEPDTRIYRIVGNDRLDWFHQSGEGLSSSLMRDQLRQGTLHPALPPALQKYIQSNGLYSCENLLRDISKAE